MDKEYKRSERKRLWDERLERWNDKLMVGFDKMAVLRQDPEVKTEISQSIVSSMAAGRLYWLQLVLSALIASLGLLQNSVAVVIGAMLIAPLLTPLQALSFAITEGKPGLFAKSLKLLIFSTLVAVLVSVGVVYSVPLNNETSEILARVSPNILDLFIAGFSAVLALLSLVYKRLLSSVAGVAMAASLIPPLSVIGIQIGFGNLDKALGASLLYATNIVAIILVGVIMFFLYGFNPHRQKTYGVVSQALFLVLVAVGLSFPLMTSIRAEQAKVRLFEQVQGVVLEVVNDEFVDGQVSELKVARDGDVVQVDLDLRLPEKVSLFEDDLEKFIGNVSSGIGEEVDMNIDIIRTATLSKKEDPLVVRLDELKADLDKRFVVNVDGASLISTSVLGDVGEDLLVKFLYLENGDLLGLDKLEESIVKDYGNDFNLSFDFIALDEVDESENSKVLLEDFEMDFVDFVEARIPNGWYVSWVESRLLSDKELGDFYDVVLEFSLPSSVEEGLEDELLNNVLSGFQLEKSEKGVNVSFEYLIDFREGASRLDYLE